MGLGGFCGGEVGGLGSMCDRKKKQKKYAKL